MVDSPLVGMTEATTPAAVPHSTNGEVEVLELFPVCAVTRAMARKGLVDTKGAAQEDENLSALFEERDEKGNSLEYASNERVVGQVEPNLNFVIEKSELIKAQESAKNLKPVLE